MQTLLKTKIGPFLVISSVLAIWTLLAAQPVQAHTLTDPSCSGLPTADDFFIPAETAALTASGTVSGNATPKKGTGASGEGKAATSSTAYYYAKITVPALTAGELMVTDGGDGPSEAALCRGSSSIASSRPSYESAHNTAAADADTAARAQTAAGADGASESTAKSALRNAATDLRNAATALTRLATALTNAGEDAAAATTAADNATDHAAAATTAADTAASGGDNPASDEAGALVTAVQNLNAAADALDTDIVFDPITALISSGTEEYVVVVTIPADDGMIADLTVSFKGVMAPTTGNDADAQNGADGGAFATNNQRITHTLMTTDPGLLTVKTTGNEVDTIGTLQTGSTDVAMDGPSGGNFEIVSPVKTDTTYSVFVDGQTRSERGDYGLKVEFGVASLLTLGTDADAELKPRRAAYFFFTAPAAPRFLTVQTQTPTAVTTATNTTGTLFSQKGLVATDTDTGAGTNFLLRAPISAGDYIVEVKGASSSTAGAYALVTSSDEATSWGSAPDMIMAGMSEALTEREAKPFSITVDKPGTLQVKTTGSTDTVGVLYGPAGQQLATDDDSGADKNFRITQQVEAGQHIVTVEEQEGKTVEENAYELVVNFIEDLSVGSEDRVAELERERNQFETERNTCQTSLTQLESDTAPVTVDATGYLGNPSDGGVRSGIGLISGWVCAANDVEIRISDAQGPVETLDAAYGTSRPDVPLNPNSGCTNANAGFGMTYNFNHLDEGMYTIGAYADGITNQRIGPERTFEVVHLVDFATADLAPFDTDASDRFLRNLDGMCGVPDFPAAGDTTMLEWEQSIQNFVISDVQ